jgi:hypothetical protein
MTWQRETLLPALNQTRDLIEMIENGPYILFDELNGIYYSDIGMTTDKTLAQTYRDIERAEWVAKCSSRYRFKVVKENEND